MNRTSGIQPAHGQRGVALMVVLILLLIMTLLGLASLRGTLMDQRMSANTYDRNLSFQSAESGLREAEAVVAPGVLATQFTTSCKPDGLCKQPVAGIGTLDRWLDSTVTWHNATKVSTAAGTPQYIIEAMGGAPNWPGCDQISPIDSHCLTPRYRVSARNAAPDGDRASVVLQANYAAATP